MKVFKFSLIACVLFLSYTCQQQSQQTPTASFQCTRSPTLGSPVNYIHKGLEQIYQILYSNNVGAIPRMILDYTETDAQFQHYGWYFPDQGQSSLLYLSLGNILTQKPTLENLFWTETNENSDPNSNFNQILRILQAKKIDGSTRQPTQFVLDRNSSNIADYTVQCSDAKQSFQHFQKHFKNDFSQAVLFFS